MADDFEALEREWAQAIAGHDVDTARRLLADDFHLSSAIWRDREIQKTAWIDTMVGQTETDSIEVYDVQSRRFGDLAVVSCRVAWRARWNGDDISDDYLVTDVWRHEDDGWKVVWRASAGAPGQRRLGT
ncbi:MAG: nuclear transport factor 2 family protein [Gaiellaceae bacterium]